MKVLVEHDEGDRRVRVVELKDTGARLYYEDGALYTHVDVAGDNLLDYVAAMDDALASPASVLLLGTAGGALATLLSRRGAKVTAVDNWQTAFDIARRWFHLPSTVKCVKADAMAFLRSTSGQWDAIAVDVFRGVKIPDAMLTSDIGALLAKAMRPGGVIVWNVADTPTSWPAQWIVRALRLSGFSPSMIPVMDGDVGNTLIVCRDTRRLAASAQEDAPADGRATVG
ncbi:spermidine synthase [Phenylobacterium sp.]|uniref:spermidine synthase n=1 Tax=Phenylobacterium sp. TaxID=1871053 RepID=UPI003BAA4111